MGNLVPRAPESRTDRLRDPGGHDEPDRRLELLHENVRKYGTVFNTVAPATDLEGVLIHAT